MATSRRDYVAVAEILSGYKTEMIDEACFNDLVLDFADFFEEDNPKFKHDKFIEACNTIKQ
jgi:hypothetical protein